MKTPSENSPKDEHNNRKLMGIPGKPIVQVVLALLGLAISIATSLILPLIPNPVPYETVLHVMELMAAGCLLGFAFRVIRRHIYFYDYSSGHQSFAFECIFQGAIAFNPQLEYPGVESAFIRKISRVPGSVVKSWFGIRSTSAFAIPLALIGLCFGLAGQAVYCTICSFISLSIVIAGSYRSVSHTKSRIRFAISELAGIVGSIVEGLFFAYACNILSPQTELWQAGMLYLFLLSIYEFSPVPFALGVMESMYIAVAVISGMTPPGLALVCLYRALRLFTVLFTILYLPRYKLNLADIFNTELSVILRKFRRPEGGWPDAIQEDESSVLLSVVIPAYNEAERLPAYLPHVIEYCEKLDGDTEILVVDDGSTDDTAAYVESVSTAHNIVKLVKQGRNQGKGAAVKRGALESCGKYVLFADADGATPIEEADNLLDVAFTGVEVVIASRTSEKVSRSFLRSLIGASFYRLTNLLAVPSVSDTQCGFKMFRSVAARKIFSQVKETGWAFDVEVLFLAQKYDYAIMEVPVEWHAVEGSKINVVKDSINMLIALWRIRRRSAGMTDMD